MTVDDSHDDDDDIGAFENKGVIECDCWCDADDDNRLWLLMRFRWSIWKQR
jgi:hypothetical protein